jgi:hypothetical protein
MIRNKFFRPMRPAGDDGTDMGGTDVLDRGDSWTPTDDDLNPDDPDGELKPDPEKTKPAPKAKEEPEDDEPEDADDQAKAKKDSRIPLNRHKEILARERAQREALEKQLAQYQNSQRVEQTNEALTKAEDDLIKMEREYNTFLADGEVEKATALMSKIRQAERAIVEHKSELRANVIASRAVEQARYDIALERIEEAYPQLNDKSDEYDESIARDVVDLKQVYMNRGDTPTVALQMAVKKLLGQEDRTQKQATEVAPRVNAKDVAVERKKAAVAKTLDALKRTPPSTRDVGMDSDKAGQLTPKDIMSMSQDDFAKLGEEQLAKMRGDAL